MANRISRTLEGLGVGLGNAGRTMMQNDQQRQLQDDFYQQRSGRGTSPPDDDLIQLLRSLGINLPPDTDPEQSS